MTRNSPINIEQALHGYSQGHSLIGTSANLTPEVRRIMLPMSDMSGNRMLGGFEQYITGYPLNDMMVFAIAKTWYADEMKRPGCVWTHSLLIQFADLPKIYDLDSLLRLFRRPQGPEDTEGYDVHFTLDQPANESPRNSSWLKEFAPEFIKKTLATLYGNPREGVLIKATDSDDYDRFCLSLWQQQWPRLRRSFSFSSGSIEPRSLNRKLLDLQIVPARTTMPPGNVRIVDLIGSVPESSIGSFPAWIDLIYNDLSHPSLLRDFLNTFGADISAEPNAFQLLAESYLFFTGENNKLDTAVRFLATKFPDCNEAAALKLNILQTAEEGNQYFLPKYPEEEILFVMGTTRNVVSFDYEKLAFRERFVRFFLQDKIKAVVLLNKIISDEPNEQGESAIKAVANALETVNIKDFYWTFSSIISVLVSLNPRLANITEFWRQNASSEAEIIRFLQRNVESSEISWKSIVEILLTIGSTVHPRMLEQSFPELISTMLSWANEDAQHLLTGQWVTYLESHPVLVLDWLKATDRPSVNVIELCVSLLDPNSSVVITEDFQPWYRLLSEPGLVTNENCRDGLKCFGLALAFNLNGEGAILLYRECFETAYRLLWRGRMPAIFWNEIEIHTPTLAKFQNWDKCKRLVRALADDIISKRYDIHSIVEAFQSPELKDRVLKRYWKVS